MSKKDKSKKSAADQITSDTGESTKDKVLGCSVWIILLGLMSLYAIFIAG